MTILNKIPVHFDQQAHTYTNTDTGEVYSGITGTLLKRLFPKKYAGISDDILAKAAIRGTAVHDQLELIEGLGAEPSTQEGVNYLRLKKEYGFRYLASEWTVSDMDRYATNIDVIYDVEDNVVDIADYKNTYRVDHDSVSWQLSICAWMLEKNNPGLRVRKIYCIWLRDANAEVYEEQRRTDEEVERLIEDDKDGLPFIPQEKRNETPPDVSILIHELAQLVRLQKELDDEADSIKQRLLERMNVEGASKYENEIGVITRTRSGVRSTFDSKNFKADNPELYEKYVKKTETGGGIRFSLKTEK